MTDAARDDIHRRILIFVPLKKDASITQGIFERAHIPCCLCSDLNECVRELEKGGGALLLTEEATVNGEPGRLIALLRHQPPWSDLPVLLMTRSGADSPAVMHAMETFGNVTLLERPMRVNALVSVARAALRARERQYQAHDYLVELERVADDLRESELRYRTLVEQVKDYAIFMTDIRGRPTSWNEGVQRVLGFAEDEFLGVDILFRIFTPQDVQKGVPQLEFQQAAITGAASDDRWMQRKDGTQFWASGVTSALRHPSGELIGFTKVMRDLTDRKRVEDALKQADRRKDEFLATLAHELRNPLAPIRNSLHILRMTSTKDPTAERVYEMMERQVNHMVRLVDDLLEVSRITRGLIELRRERIELASVVRTAIDTSSPMIEAGRHQLAISLPPEPVIVDGDPVRLAQVVANLLNNAAKYTNEGGQIWLTLRSENGIATISVRDNGIGITAAMQPMVFEMFSQVDRSTRRSQGGLGIGLTLVRSLVEMHGGSVSVKSEGEGQGTEFIITLPVSVDSKTPNVAPMSPRPSLVLTPQRVLVVDDNRDSATSLGMLLQFLGADVQVVHSGPAALAMVEKYRPAVVLLDLGMPDMDGYEVARRIRQRPEFNDTLLIAITGWGQDEDRRRAREAGFDHHLVKPADITSIQAILTSRESDETLP